MSNRDSRRRAPAEREDLAWLWLVLVVAIAIAAVRATMQVSDAHSENPMVMALAPTATMGPTATPSRGADGATLILSVHACPSGFNLAPMDDLLASCTLPAGDVAFEVQAPTDPTYGISLVPGQDAAPMTVTGIPVNGAGDAFGIVLSQTRPISDDRMARAVCRENGADGVVGEWTERPVWRPDNAIYTLTGPRTTLECGWFILPDSPATPNL
ncbi:MAG: hypothetical protein QM589_01885 [Thermomicrobiales bacterium]